MARSTDTRRPGDEEPRRGEATRLRIQEAALALFARDGFDNTTVKAIAEIAGLRDATLYYHFRSKREILDSLWERPAASALRELPVAPLLNAARLGAMVDAMLVASAEQDALIRLMVRQTMAGDPTAAALRAQTMSYWRRYLLPHLLVAFSGDDAVIRADMIALTVLGVVFQAQMDYGEEYPRFACTPAFQAHVRNLVCSVIQVEPNAA